MRETKDHMLDSETHEMIHLWSEIQKEEEIQIASARRKKKHLDRIGELLDKKVNDET